MGIVIRFKFRSQIAALKGGNTKLRWAKLSKLRIYPDRRYWNAAGSETGYAFLVISVRAVIELGLKIYCLLVETDAIFTDLSLGWDSGIRILLRMAPKCVINKVISSAQLRTDIFHRKVDCVGLK